MISDIIQTKNDYSVRLDENNNQEFGF